GPAGARRQSPAPAKSARGRRTSSSITSTPSSTAVRKLSAVLPRTRASAPLCPIRSGERRPPVRLAAAIGPASATIAATGDVEADEGAERGEDAGRGDPDDERADGDGAAVLRLELPDDREVARGARDRDRPHHRQEENRERRPEQGAAEDVEPLERALGHADK